MDRSQEQAAELIALATRAHSTCVSSHYDIEASWRGLFIADVAVKNISEQPIRDCSLRWVVRKKKLYRSPVSWRAITMR